MNNPNPFVPKGSLLEQQSLRRSRLKIAVGCVLAVSVLGLVAMLIQGCKREQPTDTGGNPPDLGSNSLAMAGSTASMPSDTSSNLLASAPASNSVPTPPPVPVPPPAPIPAPAPIEPAVTAGTDYLVVSGDTLSKIATAHGVTLKALEAANPGVDPKKLKIKQKLTIPASTKSDATSAAPTGAGVTDATGAETYTVKSNDNLGKIARKHGVSLKALKAANNLTTDHIKVGDKLKIPAKADTATPASTPTPDTSAVPVLPPMPAPASTPTAPAPTPAPGH